MDLLLDTHLLLWAAADSPRLSAQARELIAEPANRLWFSAASVWEVAIKASLGQPDFAVDPHLLRRGLIEGGYEELPVRAEHAAAVVDLEAHHPDPFDRILVAQARLEGLLLLTGDRVVVAYGSPVELV